MKAIRFFSFLFLIFVSTTASAQDIHPDLQIVKAYDTVETFIGEIHYFGRNMKKAQAFPKASILARDRYLLLWVPSKRYRKRAKIEEKSLKAYVFDAVENDFNAYPCYAFKIKQKVSDPYENGVRLYSLVFPSVVEVFELKEGQWKKCLERSVASQEEFGQLQLEMVYD